MQDLSFLQESEAVYQGHLVYKAGYAHGNLYIDKERLSKLGAIRLCTLMERVAVNAINSGLMTWDYEEIGIFGPAYGAIAFTLPLAAAFENIFVRTIKFFPARTEVVKKDGRNIHFIPDKLLPMYKGLPFIGIEDIVNNGTTIRETSHLFRTVADATILAFTSIVDRGGQTAESLGLEQYFPLCRTEMKQHDLRSGRPCPQCEAGEPITTHLGKGAEWVAMFGQPPYPPNMNFSRFWA